MKAFHVIIIIRNRSLLHEGYILVIYDAAAINTDVNSQPRRHDVRMIPATPPLPVSRMATNYRLSSLVHGTGRALHCRYLLPPRYIRRRHCFDATRLILTTPVFTNIPRS